MLIILGEFSLLMFICSSTFSNSFDFQRNATSNAAVLDAEKLPQGVAKLNSTALKVSNPQDLDKTKGLVFGFFATPRPVIINVTIDHLYVNSTVGSSSVVNSTLTGNTNTIH